MQCTSKNRTLGLAASATAVALSLGLMATAAQPAYAVTAAEKAAEAEEALTELYAMQDTLEQASSKYYKSLLEYQKAVEKCDKSQNRINEISDEIAGIQSQLGSRARDMYRSGSVSFVDLLLGAATFDEFTKNWDLLTRMNADDASKSREAKELRDEIEEQKAEYTKQASIAEEKSTDASNAYKEAQALVTQMEETYQSLSAEAQELYAQEQAAAAAAQAAAAEAAAAAQADQGGQGGQEYVEYPTEGGVQNDDGTVTDVETGEVYQSASEYSAATGNEVVDRAMSMLGASYEWGGTGADGAFDCSGLVGYALTGSYDRIGNTTTFMGYNQVSDPQPGDIAVNEGHTGIYIGNGQMVHASDESTGVIVGDVQSGMIFVRP